jgi:hypothetical protein
MPIGGSRAPDDPDTFLHLISADSTGMLAGLLQPWTTASSNPSGSPPAVPGLSPAAFNATPAEPDGKDASSNVVLASGFEDPFKKLERRRQKELSPRSGLDSEYPDDFILHLDPWWFELAAQMRSGTPGGVSPKDWLAQFPRGTLSDGGGVYDRSKRSRQLGQNLVAAGMPRPDNAAVHHVVAHGAARAAPTRKLLDAWQIGLEDAANGVWLPKNKSVAVGLSAAPHSAIHTKNYYDAVNEELQRANSREEAIGVLSNIRQRLLNNGGYP